MRAVLLSQVEDALADALSEVLAPSWRITAAPEDAEAVILSGRGEAEALLARLAALRSVRGDLPVLVLGPRPEDPAAAEVLAAGAFACLPEGTPPRLIARELELASAPAPLLEALAKSRLEGAVLARELVAARRRVDALTAILQARGAEPSRAVDPLTGLSGQDRFFERLAHDVAHGRRYGHPVSVLRMEVDGLELLREELGEAVAREVVKELGRLVGERARETDLVAHVGDGELGMVLPSTDRAGAGLLADAIRTRVGENDFVVAAAVTVSIGVAPLVAEEDADGLLMWQAAGRALREAQGAGGNRIGVAGSSRTRR